ncbi:MAG: hypothetical protein K6G62_01385 [Eubacterium sp.]|nr:hypothetical protein [Eubacterium sp.]
MKLLKNMSVKLKLALVIIPLALCIVAAVVFAGVQIKSTESEVTYVYYDVLYTVNNSLVNMDRDFHESLLGATQYYDIVNGYSTMPAEIREKKTPEKLADYEENLSLVKEGIALVIDTAKQDQLLYKEIKTEDGYSFEQAAELFSQKIEAWSDFYDVKNNSGDWSGFNNAFSETRVILADMQSITEKWAQMEHDQVASSNTAKIASSAIVFFIIILLAMVFAIYLVLQIIQGISHATGKLDELAGGDLNVVFPEDKDIPGDEIGRINRSAKLLGEKLKQVIDQTKSMSLDLSSEGDSLADSSTTASEASDQVTNAIGEISQGAGSQAEGVEEMAKNTEKIGSNIEEISSDVSEMDTCAKDMKNSCDKAMSALEALIHQREDVTNSVREIGATINSTNQSAKAISTFSQEITDIADQTNLLSLNASIESARAGEAGKGFAVVADEIRKLAEESRRSAEEIKNISDILLADSSSSVEVLEKLNSSFDQQAIQLDSTKEDMLQMYDNVKNVQSTSGNIYGRVGALQEAKNILIGVISEISAISEENAAATEETNASMEELNVTYGLISHSAQNLQRLASDLKNTISYFNS